MKNNIFIELLKNIGWDNIKHEILYTKLSKEEAEQKEIELIAKYKSNDCEYGYNVENGGHVHCVSNITKQKLKGNKNAKGHKIDKQKHLEMIAKSQTLEARTKLSKAKSKKIRCIETNVIYENSLIAEKETGIKFQNIRLVCNKKRKTAGSYHWEEVV